MAIATITLNTSIGALLSVPPACSICHDHSKRNDRTAGYVIRSAVPADVFVERTNRNITRSVVKRRRARFDGSVINGSSNSSMARQVATYWDDQAGWNIRELMKTKHAVLQGHPPRSDNAVVAKTLWCLTLRLKLVHLDDDTNRASGPRLNSTMVDVSMHSETQ